MERNFKGVWIPKEVWLSKELTIMEKLFFVEINSLDNSEGCYAGNGYFSEFFELSKTRVSVIINSLVGKGYISSTLIYKEGTKQILKRVLKISKGGYIRKQGGGIKEKFIDNNTVNNTIVNNTINKQKAKAYFDDLDINNLFIEFLDLRKSLKAKNTDRAISLVLKKLEGLSKETQKEMLEQSIENSWKSVFPIKKQFNKEKPSLAKKYFPEMFDAKDPFKTNLKIESNDKY
tara:strand:- start:268 stop:963 length:696 start_codon:yes stop_codon:yes gene_type:complete